MSMKLTAQVLEMTVGGAAKKLVLVCLADIAGKDGTCYPSYQHIAKQCEMSKRSVIDHIRQLESDGLLKKTTRKSKQGNSSNVYKITLEGSEKSAPPSEKSASGVVQDLHGGSEKSAPTPSAESAPRTSNTSEPVNEPEKKESDFSAVRVAHYLHKRLVSEIPEVKVNPDSWVTEIERAIRIDGRSEKDLVEIIDWMHGGDKFWVANIQSGKKLREKYNTLIGQKRQRVAANDPKPADDWAGPRI